MTGNRNIMDLRTRLTALAAYPEDGPVKAWDMARHFAIRAQERWVRQLDGRTDIDHQQLAVMAAEFAAAHALYSAMTGARPDDFATEIRDALEDGGVIGEWLWDYLGDETCSKVRELTEALMAAQQEAAR